MNTHCNFQAKVFFNKNVYLCFEKCSFPKQQPITHVPSFENRA